MYGKIFDSIYTGTLYGQWQAIVTFQQMIVLCDADGIVDMTPPGIAAITSIPLDIITKGLEVLSAPDPYSRTPGAEGRRIELIDAHRPWGWQIVNHDKYKRLQDADTVRAQTRERVRKHRESKGKDVTVGNGQETKGNGSKRHTDTDTDTDTKRKREATPRGSRLPLTDLPEDWKTFCLAERPDLLPSRVFADFSDYWKAKPGKDGVKLDWLATWRKWVRGQRATVGVLQRADGKITCESCGTRTSSYTGRQCDPCWRSGAPRRVAI